MGQRLVISINKGDREIANAYYHWSGFSYKALDLTKEIYNLWNKDEALRDEHNEYIQAILLLQCTGARVAHEKDIEYFEACLVDKSPLAENIVCNAEQSRDVGLISLLPEVREFYTYWAEARIIIDIQYLDIDYGVFCGKAFESQDDCIRYRKDYHNENKREATKYYKKLFDNAVTITREDGFKRGDILQPVRTGNGTYLPPFPGIEFDFDKLEDFADTITKACKTDFGTINLVNKNGNTTVFRLIL